MRRACFESAYFYYIRFIYYNTRRVVLDFVRTPG